ncbi:glycoside hydrolase family 43 protein [Cercospora zeae-maydis SCOH1-5]|uniref:Glycoside hydrolase family 43 protein n=1 Tax=Cercospora zeae-maydis SCOH1-5 TaxID=717836 RepID=A0A6A6FWH8_9PEZI|nr:glycoside hydrolase family 43 protein [Cercospora zeae-maydis SCOH1-5]
MRSTSLFAAAGLLSAASASPIAQQQDAQDEYVGYFGTFFPLQDEAIYGWLSNGNDAHSWTQLNGPAGNGSILRSNVGTTGDGSKWWLIATDLKVNDFDEDFNEATRFGSRSIVVWESEDLATWSEARLTDPIVDVSAGNVWAPEADWDPLIQSYVLVYASRFWDPADVNRTGPQPPNRLMYSTTQDFVTFSEAKEYYFPGYPVIDATFWHATEEGPDVWYRWIKSEVDYLIYQERSENGMLGTFTRVGGAPDSERIEFAAQYENNEGPLIFRDNVDSGLYHLWIDQNTFQSYVPATARTLNDMAAWEAESLEGFPSTIKHACGEA